MDSTFTLDIITPEHQYFADKVDEIILTSDLGELALKAHHLDLIANIVICPLVYLSAAIDIIMRYQAERFSSHIPRTKQASLSMQSNRSMRLIWTAL